MSPLCLAEPSGPAVCSDSHTDVDSYSKEHAFCPQLTSRDSTQPGTPSSQEPLRSDREHSPRLNRLHSGTGDGSPPDCRESLYPSNHDRMLPPWKRKPRMPPEGKGKPSLPSSPPSRWQHGNARPGLMGLPFLQGPLHGCSQGCVSRTA